MTAARPSLPRRVPWSAVIVFVALDAPEGTPVAVPAWTPATEEDRRLGDYAREVMALGRGIEPLLGAVG